MSNNNAGGYPLVRLELPPQEGDFATWISTGWRIFCYACGERLGRLFIPFSGGFILSGSSAHLDARLVERPTPETRTGNGYRRYGPPARVFTKGKRSRLAADERPGLSINGPFWINCHACNAGQALEPENINKRAQTSG